MTSKVFLWVTRNYSINKTRLLIDGVYLTYERKKLYNIGTAILNGDNDDNHHNKKKKKNKKKKLSKKEYIERLEMQEKWFAHYGRNKWY